MFKGLYEYEKLNKNKYDEIREYCLTEKMNEGYYRYCMNKSKTGHKYNRPMVRKIILTTIATSMIVLFFPIYN